LSRLGRHHCIEGETVKWGPIPASFRRLSR
jgi:hypothetical protein